MRGASLGSGAARAPNDGRAPELRSLRLPTGASVPGPLCIAVWPRGLGWPVLGDANILATAVAVSNKLLCFWEERTTDLQDWKSWGTSQYYFHLPEA